MKVKLTPMSVALFSIFSLAGCESVDSTEESSTQFDTAGPRAKVVNAKALPQGVITDLFWRRSDDGRNYIYQMNGATIVSQGTFNTVAPEWDLVGRGDFDGDGQLDLFWRHDNGDNWIYLMEDRGIKSSRKLNNTPNDWAVVGIEDFNGDGRADVLWRNINSGKLWLYELNGTSIQSSNGVGGNVALHWDVESVGDISGDGRADVIWRNTQNGQVWIYELDGHQILSSHGLATVNAEWALAGLGDFNGDGTNDLLWRNQTSGVNWVYQMSQGQIGGSYQLNIVGDLNWSIATSDDFNGDGTDDLVWYHAITGDTYLYTLNNGSITSAQKIGTISDTQWQLASTQPGDTPEPPTTPTMVGMTYIDGETWDETAVRKVLHTFAFGGFATDTQIKTWANMTPQAAIEQILTFEPHNPFLSPIDPNDPGLANSDGTLLGLSQHWSTDSADNGMQVDRREQFALDYWRSPERILLVSSNVRGLNPFRQKVGLWETNYHMVGNAIVGVSREQIVRHFDNIMIDLADNEPYQQVLATGAESAAIARQYGHYDNRMVDGVFEGNEDFAREYHQLFFGVLGEDDPDYHEVTTIKNTAKALTDMDLEPDRNSPDIIYGQDFHHMAGLEMYHQIVDGLNASEKIRALADITIQHQESLDNLPLMIVGGLADDNIDENEAQQLRAYWHAMNQKNLLQFLRDYAISTIFHSENRFKYWTSVERHMNAINQMTLTNQEAYLGLYDPFLINREDFTVFEPKHNVFGHQTGLEAATSTDIFREVYNRATSSYWRYSRTWEDDSDGNVIWTKDWRTTLPSDVLGLYVVKDVAEWLWQRFIADDLKNFGPLERFHVYSILATGLDAGYAMTDGIDPEHVYTVAEIEGDPRVNHTYRQWANDLMDFDLSDPDDLETANYRVGMAINFILVTPYAFGQEGR